MDVQDWLSRGAVVDRATVSGKRQALGVVADVAARTLGLQPGAIQAALEAREALGSTGVGHGVAVPHAQLDGIDRMHAVFVRLEAPAPFDAIDGRPVDLLFALFAPVGDAAAHLRALARVSRQLRRAELREHLRAARSADAIYALLAHEAAASTAA